MIYVLKDPKEFSKIMSYYSEGVYSEKESLDDFFIRKNLSSNEMIELYEISIKKITNENINLYKKKLDELKINYYSWGSNIKDFYYRISLTYNSLRVIRDKSFKYYFFYRFNDSFNTTTEYYNNLTHLKNNLNDMEISSTLYVEDDINLNDYDTVISGNKNTQKLKLGVIFLKCKENYSLIKLSQDMICSELYTFGDYNDGNYTI